MESFQEANVIAISDSGFRAVKKGGGQYNGSVDADFGSTVMAICPLPSPLYPHGS